MSSSRSYNRPLSFLLCLVYLLYPVACQGHELATFYGAYQRLRPLASDSGLNIVLNFKTSEQIGLLLAARLDHEGRNAGYLAVGINNRKLITLIQENTNTPTNASVNSTLSDVWYRLSVRMLSGNITVELTEGDVTHSLTHSLSSSLTVRDAFVGGANSFFAPAFTTLDITEYFTGCLANGSFNDRDIDFAPKLPGYGMEYGCCPDPEPVMWCFETEQSNSFTINSRLSHRRFLTDYLTLSFKIRASGNGVVFYSHDDDIDFALAVELHNGQLWTHLVNEASHLDTHTLACEGVIVNGWWHEVSIVIHQDVLECSVDGTLSRLNTSRPTLPSNSLEYHIGRAAVPTTNNNLLLFQLNLETHPNDGMFPSFSGCLQKFQLNGLDIAPPTLSSSSPSLSPACPHGNDTSAPVSNCQRLQENLSTVQIAQITVVTANTTLNEGNFTILTNKTLNLGLPNNIANPDVREAVFSTIRFAVVSAASHGQLVNLASSSQQVHEFSYLQVLNHSLAYRHNGGQFERDSIHLEVSSECSSVISEYIVLSFFIRLTNDDPVVTHLGFISIAMGTRRVITRDMISVKDEEATSLINISFRVRNITVDNCGQCGTAGKIEHTAMLGSGYTDFNQMEIDDSEIAFQHFSKFGTRPITIYLRVSDSFGASIEVRLPVVPFIGHLNLTRNQPLSVVEGRCNYITSMHLNAATDFDDQNPILQYNVTGVPLHGRLEIRKQGYWRAPGIDFDGFTQNDVNNNLVRYCHDNNSLAADSFRFQLHSTDLAADSGNFTIEVYAYTDLQQPDIVVETSPLFVGEGEGGEVACNAETLNVSLVLDVSPPWSQEHIEIEDFGVFFRLENGPLFGEIMVWLASSSGFSLSQLMEGAVTYRHDGSENHDDFLSVRIEVTNTPQLPIKSPHLPPVTNVSISINPVNNHAPMITNARLRPNEGGFVIVTSEMINIVDSDLPRQTVTVYLLNQNEDFGYFALRDTGVPVTNFTTDDIEAAALYFYHQLDSSFPLNFTIRFQATDGERMMTLGSVEIEAVPLNISTINVPTFTIDSCNCNCSCNCSVSTEAAGCVASLDAESSETLTTSLSSSPLHEIEILDRHGKDVNRLQDMSLHVVAGPEHGQLLLGNETASVFTLNDVEHGWVQYRLSNQTNPTRSDQFTVQVVYGHSSSPHIKFKICINPVPVPCVEVVQAISLVTDTTVPIRNNTLRAVDSRGRGGVFVEYHIISSPARGALLNSSDEEVLVFTQAAIDEGTISYRHMNNSNNSAALKDSFIFKVCTRYSCTENYNVTVQFSVTNLTVYNHVLTVPENGTAFITKDHLDAVAPNGGVRFHILKQPQEGTLYSLPGILYKNPDYIETILLASRGVWYVHSGSETLRDRFSFSVTAKDSEEVFGYFDIVISPVNNKVPILAQYDINVIARTTKNITKEELSAYDADSDSDSLTLLYRVIFNPTHGIIHYRNDTMKRQLTQWYEREVREGLLAYSHTSQERIQREILDPVVINLRDRKQNQTYLIQIHINEIELTLNTTPISFSVEEGGRGVLNKSHLQAIANGHDTVTLTDADLAFNLTSFPKHGNLTLGGRLVTRFTQANLSDPGLVYQHDHSNTETDGFSFEVIIPHHDVTKTGTFGISIKPIDDDPPSLVFLRKPLFVLEGSRMTISNEDIEVKDYDTVMSSSSQIAEITFEIITRPEHGVVKRRQAAIVNPYKDTERFTLYEVNHSSVVYEHHPLKSNGDIWWSDWFLVNLTDGHNVHNTSYNFTFIILPEIVEVEVSAFRVREAEAAVLGSKTICAVHPFLKTQPGCISITELPRDGYLYNSETGEINITNFTTADLSLGYIAYQHNGAEGDSDSLKFIYEAHDPQSDSSTPPGVFPMSFERESEEQELLIEVDTINDRGPEIHSDPNKPLIMWEKDCAFFAVRHLNVSDADTPPEKLIYTFNFTFDAYITNTSDNQEIVSFAQQDVISGSVKLFHRSGKMGVMYYNVTDGKFVNSSHLNIETHQLEIVFLRKSPMSVAMDDSVNITNAVLSATTSDINSTVTRCQPIESIEYRFAARYGEIVVEGMEGTDKFTQADVDAGRVSYRHTKPEFWETLERVKLSVNASLTRVKVIYLNITIKLPSEPHSPLAVHKPLVVEEGGISCLNERILDARNIRYSVVNETVRSVYSLSSFFYFYRSDNSHGIILVDDIRSRERVVIFNQTQIAAGSVCYENLGDESPSDQLNFSVFIKDEDGYILGNASDLVLNISIVLINDEPPMVTNSSLTLLVVEGFPARIGKNLLTITDEDNPASDLVYTVLEISSHGELYLGMQRLYLNDVFTQTAVNDGELWFKPLGAGEWTMSLSFTDGKFADQTNFTVVIDAHYIKLEATDVLRYSQNERGTHLTAKHIVTQTNGDPQDTIYTVIERPINGELMKGLSRGDTFNHSDLEAHNVFYIPTDFNSHTDSFVLSIFNRNATIEEQNVTIKVRVDVWGKVKQSTELDFNSGEKTSVPLPKNILKLSELQRALRRPPRITITQQPRLGYLEERIPSRSGRSSRSTTKAFTFFYDYLDYNWVYYTWNTSSNSALSDSRNGVNDSFTVLVEGYDNIQPGEATINLCIKNPPGDAPQTSPPLPLPTDSTTTIATPLEDDQGSNGFPNYALLPILGVFLFLLVIIAVVVVFCVTQQGRIRKRLQPRMPGHHWNARGQNFALHGTSNMHVYDLEPSGQGDAMTSLTEMVDRGSEYTEAHSPQSRSPLSRYSPSASHPPNPVYQSASEAEQPYHHRHMIPRPRSRRSNVSVSYSQRPPSEMTLNDLPHSRHHTFSPPSVSHFVAPIPIRPMTQCSSLYEEEESGYLSTPNQSICADLSTPNQSICADDPVRLTRRRRDQEEKMPLPVRVPPLPVAGVEGEQEFGEDGEGEEGEREEKEGAGAAVADGKETQLEESSGCEDLTSCQQQAGWGAGESWESLQQSLEPLPSAEKPIPDHEEPSVPPYREEPIPSVSSSFLSGRQALPSSNGAHAVSTVPSEPVIPPPPLSVSAASASSTAQLDDNNSSDLHTLFRTHNPILKPQEYWV